MTRTTKLLLTTGALALAAATFAGASLADGGRGWHRAGWGHHGGFGEGLFEAFDTNHDGKVTQAEVDQARQAKFTQFDANHDGVLSLEEYQALWMDAMREHMVDRFQAHDDDGDGKVTAAEFGEDYGRMIGRLDSNGDGAVTMDEIRNRFQKRGGPRGDNRG